MKYKKKIVVSRAGKIDGTQVITCCFGVYINLTVLIFPRCNFESKTDYFYKIIFAHTAVATEFFFYSP